LSPFACIGIYCCNNISGYKQSVTGCGSQRRQCSCYSMKTHVNSMILIVIFNLTLLRNIYIKSGLRWAPHTFLCICFSTKSNRIWGWGSRYLYALLLSNNYMSSLRTTACDTLIVPSGIYCCNNIGFKPLEHSLGNNMGKNLNYP